MQPGALEEVSHGAPQLALPPCSAAASPRHRGRRAGTGLPRPKRLKSTPGARLEPGHARPGPFAKGPAMLGVSQAKSCQRYSDDPLLHVPFSATRLHWLGPAFGLWQRP